MSIHRYALLLESTCVIDAGFETVAFENHPETMNIELVVSSYERILWLGESILISSFSGYSNRHVVSSLKFDTIWHYHLGIQR